MGRSPRQTERRGRRLRKTCTRRANPNRGASGPSRPPDAASALSSGTRRPARPVPQHWLHAQLTSHTTRRSLRAGLVGISWRAESGGGGYRGCAALRRARRLQFTRRGGQSAPVHVSHSNHCLWCVNNHAQHPDWTRGRWTTHRQQENPARQSLLGVKGSRGNRLRLNRRVC